MTGHFFAVVVQLLAADADLDPALDKAFLDPLQQLTHFGVTLFHRQLQVDHRLAAQAFADPGFQQGRIARWLFDDVADHPIHRMPRLEGKAVGHQMLHQPRVHQAFGHRAVVDGGDQHATAHQLIGPATRRCAKVDTGHVARQPLVPLIARDEVVPRLFQLQGRAARGFTRELQTRNAHGPHRRVARIGEAEKHLTPAFKGQKQTRLVLVFHQFAGLGQGLAQRRFELAAEIRQLFAIIGVHHFQPQAAASREIRQLRKNHADAVSLRQIEEHPARPLPGEDQLGEALAVHQAFGAIFFGADELGIGGAGLGFGVTGHVQTSRMLGDLGTDFTLKAGAAVHKQRVHSILLGNGETFSRCALRVSPEA